MAMGIHPGQPGIGPTEESGLPGVIKKILRLIPTFHLRNQPQLRFSIVIARTPLFCLFTSLFLSGNVGAKITIDIDCVVTQGVAVNRQLLTTGINGADGAVCSSAYG